MCYIAYSSSNAFGHFGYVGKPLPRQRLSLFRLAVSLRVAKKSLGPTPTLNGPLFPPHTALATVSSHHVPPLKDSSDSPDPIRQRGMPFRLGHAVPPLGATLGEEEVVVIPTRSLHAASRCGCRTCIGRSAGSEGLEWIGSPEERPGEAVRARRHRRRHYGMRDCQVVSLGAPASIGAVACYRQRSRASLRPRPRMRNAPFFSTFERGLPFVAGRHDDHPVNQTLSSPIAAACSSSYGQG